MDIVERLQKKRIPWSTFTDADLEQVGSAAYLRGDSKLLRAVRRETLKRDLRKAMKPCS